MSINFGGFYGHFVYVKITPVANFFLSILGQGEVLTTPWDGCFCAGNRIVKNMGKFKTLILLEIYWHIELRVNLIKFLVSNYFEG